MKLLKKQLQLILNIKKFDWSELKTDVRNSLEKFLYKQTNRRPVVLPVIMEVNQNRHRAMARKKTEHEPRSKKAENND